MPRRYRKKGGFLPILPILAAAIPAILGTVAGGLDIAQRVKQLKQGSGLKRRRQYRKKGRGIHKKRASYLNRRKKGRGFVSDFLGHIPLLGQVLGPLAGKMGLGLSHMNMHALPTAMGHYGRGLVMKRRRMVGGLLAPAGGRVKVHRRKGHYRMIKKGRGVKRVHVRATRVGGYIPYA